MYNYIDFDFDFTYNKAMKEKVSGVLGDPVSARVHEILITVLYIYKRLLPPPYIYIQDVVAYIVSQTRAKAQQAR